jgi:cation:H+ antiporter
MLVWLQFVALTGVILFAGTNLSRYADIIAEKTGLGRTFIGVVLLASVTSLPELITGLSSVAVFGVPDIAVGDVLGSCMFNLLILALADVAAGGQPLSARAHQGQVLTAAFGILLLGLVSLTLVAGAVVPAIGWISIASIVLLALYLLATRLIFLYERRRIAEFVREVAEEARYEHISKRRAYGMYTLYAALIVAAAGYLPHLGEQIAAMTGLGQTFVGNMFIATSTSLPEIIVSFAALRLGAVDMVYGNLLGSNLFDVAILAIDDFFYRSGPLYLSVTANHVLAALTAMVMTAIVIIGLTYRVTRKRPLPIMAWDTLSLVLMYVVAAALLYRTR